MPPASSLLPSNMICWKNPQPGARDVAIELSNCPGCLVQTEQANLLLQLHRLKAPMLPLCASPRRDYPAGQQAPSLAAATPRFLLISLS